MRLDFPINLYVERLAEEVAGRWGIDPVPLRNCLDSLVNQMSGRSGEESKKALRYAAEEHRNKVLRPILRALYDWVYTHVTRRAGDRLDDALGAAMETVLRYWKPSWATPAGQQHLRAYVLLTIRQRIGRGAQTENTRAVRILALEPPPPPPDPEAQILQALTEEERAIALSKLRDMDFRLRVLTPAEADAVGRWLSGDPTASLPRVKKALYRAMARLQQQVPHLVSDRRRHRRNPAGYPVLIHRPGLTAKFQVIDESTGGLGLEAGPDGAVLELGTDYMVRTSSDRSVLVRGARCVRVQRTARGLRIGLQFHFQHPLLPPVRRAQRERLSR